MLVGSSEKNWISLKLSGTNYHDFRSFFSLFPSVPWSFSAFKTLQIPHLGLLNHVYGYLLVNVHILIGSPEMPFRMNLCFWSNSCNVKSCDYYYYKGNACIVFGKGKLLCCVY